MEKKTETKYVDDGRTIADMSADWMPWNRGFFRRRKNGGTEEKRKKTKDEKREEKRTYRAAVMAMYRAVLPVVICVAGSFLLVFFLLKFWLS